MRQLLCLLLTLITPVLLIADDAADKELQALQGKWKAVSLEANGQQLPKEATPEFVFNVGAAGKSVGQMGKMEYKSTITVDPTKSPKTIVNHHDDGMFQGKKQYGVYKLEGDKWIVCMSAPGIAEKDRPTSFETKGNGNIVFTFERVKEEKKR